METQRFDIIIIGAGSGGLNIASFMNRIGKRVLLIDKSDEHIGGDCLNFGCVPSKALIHVAREVKAAAEASRFGVTTTGALSWPLVRDYIKKRQDVIREHENRAWFESKGITVVLGEAYFSGSQTVMVSGVAYTAKKIVLATGSRPRTITGQGIEKVKRVLNNENVFSMDSLPKRLLVLGAGPIGIEIGQALSFLGSHVTVVDPGSQILSKEDPEIATVLSKKLENEGVVLQLKTKLKEFTGSGRAILTKSTGEEYEVEFDAVFVSIGRVLNTESLSLEKAGIAHNNRGDLIVDEYLRTTNPHVYVCGDVAGNYQFTHAAEAHATLIIRNLLSPFKKKFSDDTFAWVTYTTPEIATFGLSVDTLNIRKVRHEVLSTSFFEDDRAITDDYQYGMLKLIIAPGGKILGGSMVAPHAGELVQELILAQSVGLALTDLFNKVYPYPTATRINKRVAAGYAGAKLTPRTKRLLSFLYTLFN